MAKVNDRFASAHEMVREYQELEKEMADPSIHDDQGKARKLGRRYAQLGPVVAGFNAWKSAADDLEAAREMAAEDESFATEIPAMEVAVEAAADKLEELLLTEDLRQQRLQQIKQKDQEAKLFQNAVFGAEGELFKAKKNALKPILDEISKAVEKVVRQKRLDFLFDKANDGLALIYTNPVHDYSDYILEELGLELDPNLKK